MPIGLKDIARTAGVSVGTVSDILNRGRESLYSRETRDKVVALSQQYQYRPQHSARAMRSNKTRVVGFAAANFSPDGLLDNYPTYSFVVGLNHRLSADGYHVGMVELAELEGSACQPLPLSLRERFFDALVIHYGLSDRAARFAENLGLPLVWWDAGMFEPRGCMYRDEKEVTEEVLHRLLDLGHRRIAYTVGDRGWKSYTAGEPQHYSYLHRLDAYRGVMKAPGLAEMLLIGYDPVLCAEQLARYRATAVVVLGSDTSVVAEPARRLGWSIPGDISIVSLDMERRVPRHGLQMAGMFYDRYEAGRQAGDMVLSMLANDGESPPSVKLKGQFEPGQTLRRPASLVS